MNRMIVRSITAVVVLMALLSGCDHSQGGIKAKKAGASTAGESQQREVVDTASAARSSEEGDGTLPARLTGRWLRSDGDYIIEIISLNADGTANVRYFNPGSINVEKGEWGYSSGKLLINVVLRDVNYPGSIYSLGYNAGNDTFTGSYYQAVEGVYYNVVFTRKR